MRAWGRSSWLTKVFDPTCTAWIHWNRDAPVPQTSHCSSSEQSLNVEAHTHTHTHIRVLYVSHDAIVSSGEQNMARGSQIYQEHFQIPSSRRDQLRADVHLPSGCHRQASPPQGCGGSKVWLYGIWGTNMLLMIQSHHFVISVTMAIAAVDQSELNSNFSFSTHTHAHTRTVLICDW